MTQGMWFCSPTSVLIVHVSASQTQGPEHHTVKFREGPCLDWTGADPDWLKGSDACEAVNYDIEAQACCVHMHDVLNVDFRHG